MNDEIIGLKPKGATMGYLAIANIVTVNVIYLSRLAHYSLRAVHILA